MLRFWGLLVTLALLTCIVATATSHGSGGVSLNGTPTLQCQKILVYSTRATGTALRATDFDEDLPAILAQDGNAVFVFDRASMPVLTPAILSNYDQLWFISTETPPVLSTAEVQAILAFHDTGKGIMVIGDGYTYTGPANQFLTLGVRFTNIRCWDCNHCGANIGCCISTAGFVPHPIWNGVTAIQANLNEGDLEVVSTGQIIATHNNINMVAVGTGPGGQVAWDATVYRFSDATAHPNLAVTYCDNPRYVRNLANWLSTPDTTDPTISVSLNRDVLWPPNHKMVDITAAVTVTDNCCATPTFKLVSITSNEPDNGKGDGDTIDDIQGADYGTPDVTFQLRSERSGKGDGRVYTIVYEAEDCFGNKTTATAEVRVPHDHSGMALASVGYTADGSAIDASTESFAVIIPSAPARFGLDNEGNTIKVAEPFDATRLDVTKAYVGNTAGAISPFRSLKLDNNRDGLVDLVLFYSAANVRALVMRSSIAGDALKIDEEGIDGPVGFHYNDVAGVDYLVSNIFELGRPVPLALPTEKKRQLYEQDLANRDQQLVTTLLPAYPNPFNPTTTIPFDLATQGRVSLRIFDTQGKLVRTLCDEVMPSGIHQSVWDGRDNAGHHVATGVYFVRLVTGDYQMTRKLVMIK